MGARSTRYLPASTLISDRSIHLDLSTWRIACNAEWRVTGSRAERPSTFGLRNPGDGIACLAGNREYDLSGPEFRSASQLEARILPLFTRRFVEKVYVDRKKRSKGRNFRELADRVVKIGSGGNNNKFGLRGHGDRDSAATTVFFFEPRVHTSGQENFVNGKCGKTLYVFFERHHRSFR